MQRAMNMECLANELLLDLFDYLSSADLLRAFYGLNLRFKNLLCIHFQSSGLDFRSISQYDFNLICSRYLPSIADHVIFLRLSNDDDTPQQIDVFLEHGLSIRQFNNLRSLSLCDLCSKEIMNRMMLEWKYLPNLTHLTLAGCYLRLDQINAQQLIDSIWSLSKLIYCYLNMDFGEICVLIPTVMSSSLKYLFIWDAEHHPNEINALLKQTPYLEHFSIALNVDPNDDIRHTVSSITKLKLYLSRSEEDIIGKFLQNNPNLSQMTIDICSLQSDYTTAILNGYQWENIIRNYLPNLRIFRFKMNFQIIEKNNREQQINDIFNSFQTSFWIDEHHWYVRCHWNNSGSIYLYTLPYNFDYFNFDSSMHCKSTDPDDNKYLYYNRVDGLEYETSTSGKVVSSSVRFLNVKHLSIHLPINDDFWTIIPNQDQVTSLDVYINDDINAKSQLQKLINQMSSLYSLSFKSFTLFDSLISLFELTNVSIRRLDLRGCNQFFTAEHCLALTRSSLGIQCEILFIQILNHHILLDLINNMINLRTLHIHCKDDRLDTTKEDMLILWMKEQLPSTCIISRDFAFDHDIRIWIR